MTSMDLLLMLGQARGAPPAGGVEAIGLMCGLCCFSLVMYSGMQALLYWGIFTKAGQPGWASLIPIYDKIVLNQIVGRPSWWVVLEFIPIAQMVVQIFHAIDIAKCFGKEPAWAIGMIFLPIVFYPMIGFGDAQYLGPIAETGAGYAPPGQQGYGQKGYPPFNPNRPQGQAGYPPYNRAQQQQWGTTPPYEGQQQAQPPPDPMDTSPYNDLDEPRQ